MKSRIPEEVLRIKKAHEDGKISKAERDRQISLHARSFAADGTRRIAGVEQRAGTGTRNVPAVRGRFTLADAMAMSPSAAGPNAFISESDLQIWLDEGLIDGIE